MRLFLADEAGRNFKSGMKGQNTAEEDKNQRGKRCPWEGQAQRITLRSRVSGTLGVDKTGLKMDFYCVAVTSPLALHSRA